MIAVIVFAVLMAGFLMLVVALFGKNPSVRRSEQAAAASDRPRRESFPPDRFRALVIELLEAMGLSVEAPSSSDGASERLVAVQKGPFRDMRHIVFIESAPAGDVVDQTVVLELVEQVKTEWGAAGILVTPYVIEREGIGGLDVAVDLIDGERLRELVARELPHWLPEISRYRLGGSSAPRKSAVPVRNRITEPLFQPRWRGFRRVRRPSV